MDFHCLQRTTLCSLSGGRSSRRVHTGLKPKERKNGSLCLPLKEKNIYISVSLFQVRTHGLSVHRLPGLLSPRFKGQDAAAAKKPHREGHIKPKEKKKHLTDVCGVFQCDG